VKKYSKGVFKMGRLGIELTGKLSPLLRTCTGVGIVLVCAAPFISAVAALILALHWG